MRLKSQNDGTWSEPFCLLHPFAQTHLHTNGRAHQGQLGAWSLAQDTMTGRAGNRTTDTTIGAGLL